MNFEESRSFKNNYHDAFGKKRKTSEIPQEKKKLFKVQEKEKKMID